MAIDSRAVLIAELQLPAAATPSTLDGAGAQTFVGNEMQGFSSIFIAIDPASTPVGTITVMALWDPSVDETSIANYVTVQSPPGTDVAIAADKGILLKDLPFPALVLKSDMTEDDIVKFNVFGYRGGK